MTKGEILNSFQDINYMYNDCGMKETLNRCLDEYADEIIDEFLRELFQMKMPHDWFAIQDLAVKLKEQIKEPKNEEN